MRRTGIVKRVALTHNLQCLYTTEATEPGRDEDAESAHCVAMEHDRITERASSGQLDSAGFPHPRQLHSSGVRGHQDGRMGLRSSRSRERIGAAVELRWSAALLHHRYHHNRPVMLMHNEMASVQSDNNPLRRI